MKNLYTKKEDEIIKQCVMDNPNNITFGLNLAAKRINRSYGAVLSRWYGVLKKQENILDVATSTKTGKPNTKNVAVEKEIVNNSRLFSFEITFEQVLSFIEKFTMDEKQRLLVSLIK